MIPNSRLKKIRRQLKVSQADLAGIDKIFVSLILEGQEHEVGELVLEKRISGR